jgi:pimeloyl-ACP methyl ester carboxylesterase
MLLFCLLALADTTQVIRISVAPAETLSVTVTGSGDPIVLLPGLFGASYGWRHLTPLLVAEGFQVLAIEPLGIGASSRPKDADYSLTAQASRIAAVSDSLGIDHAVVLAHAIGASIAFRLAIQRPDLVEGIVSIGGGPTEEAVTSGFRRSMKFAPAIKLFGGRDLFRSIVHGRLVESAGDDPSWITEDVVHGYTEGAAHDLGATIDAFRGMGRADEPWTLASTLPQITAPVRLMIGTADHAGAIPADEIEILQSTLRAFAIASVPNVGLYIFEERPEAVVETIMTLCNSIADQN